MTSLPPKNNRYRSGDRNIDAASGCASADKAARRLPA